MPHYVSAKSKIQCLEEKERSFALAPRTVTRAYEFSTTTHLAFCLCCPGQIDSRRLPIALKSLAKNRTPTGWKSA